MRQQSHFCDYRLIKTSVSPTVGGLNRWTERCKCGRSVIVSQGFAETGRKVVPILRKYWYNRDGVLERTTGDGLTENASDTKAGNPDEVLENTQ